MELNEYQKLAGHTDLMSGELTYHALALAGEAGEVAGKVSKLLRNDVAVNSKEFDNAIDALAYELGDTLYHVARSAYAIGFDLETIARMNIEKLTARKENGTLRGNGDNR